MRPKISNILTVFLLRDIIIYHMIICDFDMILFVIYLVILQVANQINNFNLILSQVSQIKFVNRHNYLVIIYLLISNQFNFYFNFPFLTSYTKCIISRLIVLLKRTSIIFIYRIYLILSLFLILNLI